LIYIKHSKAAENLDIYKALFYNESAYAMLKGYDATYTGAEGIVCFYNRGKLILKKEE
jgi:hypothetical protein